MGELIDLLPLPYSDAVVAVGAALLGLTAGVLGTFAVLRSKSMLGDALAHSALPGVALAFLVTGTKDTGPLLVGAGMAGLVGAVLIVGIERTGRIRPDAAIGVVLSTFFSLGVVLLTYIAGLNDADQAGLDSYLFGQAAGLLERDLTVMGWLALLALAVVLVAFRAFKVTLFDQAFAASIGLPVRVLELAMTGLVVIAVIVGVRAVGAILMVALLVVPAVTARQLTGRLGSTLVLAGVVGAVVGVTGSLASMQLQVPTGPVIVLVGFAVVVTAVLVAPGRGALWRAGKLRRDRKVVRCEGVLVDLGGLLAAGPPPSEEELLLAGSRSSRELRRALRDLEHDGSIRRDRSRLHLLPAGAAASRSLEERHELWALWLEHGSELDMADACEPDPFDLVTSLGRQQVEQLRVCARSAGGARAFPMGVAETVG